MGARLRTLLFVALLIGTSLACTLTGAAFALQRPHLESLETDTLSSLHADYSRDPAASLRPPLLPGVVAAAAGDDAGAVSTARAGDSRTAEPPPSSGVTPFATPDAASVEPETPQTDGRSPVRRTPTPADQSDPPPAASPTPPAPPTPRPTVPAVRETPRPADTPAPAKPTATSTKAPMLPSSTPIPSNTPHPTTVPTKPPVPTPTRTRAIPTSTPCPVLIILPLCIDL